MKLEFKPSKNQFSGAKHAGGWYRSPQYTRIRYSVLEYSVVGPGTQVWRVVDSASRLLKVRSQNLVLDGASNQCPVLEQVGFGAHLAYIGLKSGSEGAQKQILQT